MSEPTFPDLRAFLDRLRRDGDLAVVEAPVDARLEAEEIHRRVIAAALGSTSGDVDDGFAIAALRGGRPVRLVRSFDGGRAPERFTALVNAE